MLSPRRSLLHRAINLNALLLLLSGLLPELVLGPVMYLVLGSATGLKLLCWAVCAALQSRSDSMLALAEVRGVRDRC
jgi:hypothetical protein